MFLCLCRVLNEQMEKFRLEASELRVQNAKLASQVGILGFKLWTNGNSFFCLYTCST